MVSLDALHMSLIACLILLSGISIAMLVCLLRNQNTLDWMFSERVMVMDDRLSALEDELASLTPESDSASCKSDQLGVRVK